MCLYIQRWHPRWSDGVGAVSHGLGHGAGEQLRGHRGAFRRARQRLPGHQPAAQDPEEAGRVRGAGSDGGTQVDGARWVCVALVKFILNILLTPIPQGKDGYSALSIS